MLWAVGSRNLDRELFFIPRSLIFSIKSSLTFVKLIHRAAVMGSRTFKKGKGDGIGINGK